MSDRAFPRTLMIALVLAQQSTVQLPESVTSKEFGPSTTDSTRTTQAQTNKEFADPSATFQHQFPSFVRTRQLLLQLTTLLDSLAKANIDQTRFAGKLGMVRHSHRHLQAMISGQWNQGRDADQAAQYLNDTIEYVLPSLECELRQSRESRAADGRKAVSSYGSELPDCST